MLSSEIRKFVNTFVNRFWWIHWNICKGYLINLLVKEVYLWFLFPLPLQYYGRGLLVNITHIIIYCKHIPTNLLLKALNLVLSMLCINRRCVVLRHFAVCGSLQPSPQDRRRSHRRHVLHEQNPCRLRVRLRRDRLPDIHG